MALKACPHPPAGDAITSDKLSSHPESNGPFYVDRCEFNPVRTETPGSFSWPIVVSRTGSSAQRGKAPPGWGRSWPLRPPGNRPAVPLLCPPEPAAEGAAWIQVRLLEGEAVFSCVTFQDRVASL